jgi:hypothetical protein
MDVAQRTANAAPLIPAVGTTLRSAIMNEVIGLAWDLPGSSSAASAASMSIRPRACRISLSGENATRPGTGSGMAGSPLKAKGSRIKENLGAVTFASGRCADWWG